MKLKAVTFNIRCCDDGEGYLIPERAPRLKQVLESVDADVIGFQEARGAWENILEADYSERYHIFLQHRGDDESSPILWKKDRFNLIKKGCFWLSDTPEEMSRGWDELYNCYRICMYAILEDKKTGKRFNFMNTHYGFGDKCQTDSSKLLYQYSRSLSDYPTFITGDFNMRPDTPGYAELVKHFTDVNAATLQYTGTTYHGYHPETVDAHIDYCFIDNSITPLKTVLLDDTFDGKYVSDHFGFLFELEV